MDADSEAGMTPGARKGKVPAGVATRWDVVVIGAGPAGSAAAIAAAGSGMQVLLVERAGFPRYKVCGCCLNPSTLAMLRHCGLDLGAAELGVELSAVHIRAGDRAVRLDLPGGRAVSRERLDAALLEVARARGVTVTMRTRAEIGNLGDGERGVLLIDAERAIEVSARLVILANGLAVAERQGGARESMSTVARVGLGRILSSVPGGYECGTVTMAAGSDGYVGLVRLADGRLNVAAAVSATALRQRGAPGEVVDSILQQVGLPAIGAPEGWRGTPRLRARRPPVRGVRVVAVGDAAGFWEPFTGEGIAWALESGRSAGTQARRLAENWSPRLACRWAREQGRRMRRVQLRSRLLGAVLERPRLVGFGLGIAAWRPRMMDWIVPGAGDTRARGEG